MDLPTDYPALLASLDDWQSGVRDSFPGVVPCRAGCSACCHGPFDISVADVREVRGALARLAPEKADRVRAGSAAQLRKMQALDPAFADPWDVAALGADRFDALVEALADQPCPALDEGGHCLIYQGRPMVCRIMGLGLETEGGEVIENACPIQEEFPEYRELPAQRFDLARWETGERAAMEAAARALFGSADRVDYETTIAGAVLLSPPMT